MDPEMRKNRTRMMMDIYSIIFPHLKTGLTTVEIEQKMMESLGYTYEGNYSSGGFSSLVDLLNTHDKIISLKNGRYTVKCSKETEDLAQLILKQKNTGKKKGKGASKPLIPKNVLNQTINPRLVEPTPKCTRPPPAKKSIDKALKKFPFVGDVKPKAAPAKIEVPPAKPKTKKKATTSEFLGIPGGSVRQVVPLSTNCEIPSIVEFKKQVYDMLVEVYPKTILVSDMDDFYYRRYGIRVNPVSCYSKTWLFFSKTTFKDFMEVRNGAVQLIDSVASKIPVKPPSPPPPAQVPSTSYAGQTVDKYVSDKVTPEDTSKTYNVSRAKTTRSNNEFLFRKMDFKNSSFSGYHLNHRTPSYQRNDDSIYQNVDEDRIDEELICRRFGAEPRTVRTDSFFPATAYRENRGRTNHNNDYVHSLKDSNERLKQDGGRGDFNFQSSDSFSMKSLRTSCSDMLNEVNRLTGEDLRMVNEAQYSYIDDDSF